jgi:hypothetical protein
MCRSNDARVVHVRLADHGRLSMAANETQQLPLRFMPPSSVDVQNTCVQLIFINDEMGNTEDTFALNILYQKTN